MVKQMACVFLALVLGATVAAHAHAAAIPKIAHAYFEDEFMEGTCGSGMEQSPINYDTSAVTLIAANKVLTFDGYSAVEVSVEDTGKGVAVSMNANPGGVTVNGVSYTLLQFHFHEMSEETVDGEYSSLDAHLVHADADGNLLVVGLLFQGDGPANAVIQNALNNINDTTTINPGNLLPSNPNSYFHNAGSLTTPPCSEGVQWYMMSQVQSVSNGQLDALRVFYTGNYRPIQPLNARTLYGTADLATSTPTPSPTVTPSPTPTPVCIEAEWIEARGLDKVHASDGVGELMCIVGLDDLPCGTPDHVLEVTAGDTALRTYAEVCAERDCTSKIGRFNGVLHSDAHKLPSQDGHRLTTVSHRGTTWSGIENRFVVAAQKMQWHSVNRALAFMQRRNSAEHLTNE